MKKSRIFALACAVLILSSMSFCLISPVKAASATTQLCLVLDDSTSLTFEDWVLIKEGVADAIRNDLPHDGTVELTVIVFPWTNATPARAGVAVAPIVIDGTNYESVALAVEALPDRPNPPGDETCTADALYLGWKTMVGSAGNFSTATKHIINLATDGIPNVRNNNATTDLDGSGGLPDAYDDVIAVVTASFPPLTELDVEGISIDAAATEWFRNWVVYPQEGNVAPPFTPGWIYVVDTIDEFASAVATKFAIIFGGPPELTIVKTGPLLAQPGDTFSYYITITNIGGHKAAFVILNDTLPPLVNYMGSNPIGTTDDITHTIQWNLGNISVGGSVVVQLTVQVSLGAVEGDILTNFANTSWHDDPGIPYGPVNDTWITTIRIPEQPVGGYVLDVPLAAYLWLPVAMAIVLALVVTVMVQSNRYRLRL